MKVMNSIFVIANPSSGRGEAGPAGKALKDLYESKEDTQVEIHFTETEDDIAAFAEEASRKGFNYIVIIGGDGSVNLLINAYKNLDYRPKVGIIPTGTVNNIANAFHINRNYHQAVHQFAAGKELKADVGQVNDKLFVSSVSAGTIPEQAWEVSSTEKNRLGAMAYVMNGLQKLTDQKTISFDIEIDDKKERMNLDLLLVGISDSVAGISNFFGNATYNDGYLHMFGLKQSSIREKIGELSRLAITKADDDDNLTFTISFKKATIYSAEQHHYASVDGEKGPKFPLTIKVLPKFVTFIVPAEH